MSQTYQKLTIEDFGQHLLDTEDLDPVYGMLKHSGLEPWFWKRWCLAYWCFYHVGLACWVGDSTSNSQFWGRMEAAALNDAVSPLGGRFPRSSERRHFRGQACVKSIDQLQARYLCPEDMATYVFGEGGDFKEITKRAQEHHLFGPWIGFKIADMAERVFDIPVTFTEAHIFMFKDPEKAAWMVWKERNPGLAEAMDKGTIRPKRRQVLHGVTDYLIDHFKFRQAPPDKHGRLVGIQEVETILCKWKSHMNGHYPLWNDTNEIRHGLELWGQVSTTAKLFLEQFPEEESCET